MEMKLSATRGHLLLEEILSGDTSEKVEDVWALLDESAWYVDAVLKGGKNDEGVFQASTNPQVIESLNKAKGFLETFRGLGEKRYAAMMSGTKSGAGSQADEQFDQSFELYLQAADTAEEIIHDEMDVATADISTAETEAFILMSLIAIASLVGTVVTATLIGRQISGRVVGLSKSMEGVAGGSLAATVPHTDGQDEVGTMARSLLKLRDSLAEAERQRRTQDALEEKNKLRQEQLEQAVKS
jgi:methyl-accepting chemotaxis protein